MDILQDHQYRQGIQTGSILSIWTERVILLFVFTMPFLSAFALTPIFSIPFLLCVLLFGLMLISILEKKRLPEKFFGFDIIFVSCFLFIVMLSFLANGLGHQKSLNHTTAYISSFILFYITLKYILFNVRNSKIIFRKILAVLTITVLISAVFAIVEFVLNNFYGINLNDYVFRPQGVEVQFDARVLGLFIRSRGFSEEPGHFAFMMELFWPLVVYYLYFSGFCTWKRIWKSLSVLTIFMSFITAFSTASFFILPVSIAIATFLYLKSIFEFFKRYFVQFSIAIAIISVILVLIYFHTPIVEFIRMSIEQKLGGYGYDYRKDNLNFFFTKFPQFDITNKFIGIGPGSTYLLGVAANYAILNLYFSITFELGLLATIFIFFLLLYCILHIHKLSAELGYFFTISIFSGMIHYYFIANYYYPWFWFVLVFLLFCAKKLKWN